MKWTTAFLTLLGPSVALAAPKSVSRAASTIRKASRPMISASSGINTTEATESTNWSGAVLISSGYTSVTGSIIVPSIPASSGSTEKVGSAWVGIDGYSCGSLWQTGIAWYVQGSTVEYTAWYEWVPYSASVTFTGITISAGDELVFTVTATSTTSGTATIENVTTGKTVSHTYSSMASQYALCEKNAVWIVEDFAECLNSDCSQYEFLPFADYGTVEFTGCSAVKSGATVGVTGATIFDMVTSSGSIESSCSDTSSTVTCTYE